MTENSKDLVNFLSSPLTRDKMHDAYLQYLIVENWNTRIRGELFDQTLTKYAHRLNELFMHDEQHLSIHDIAYALCEEGIDANDEQIYQLALDCRY